MESAPHPVPPPAAPQTDALAEAEAIIVRRMQTGEPWTYAQMCALTYEHDKSGRIADRFHQRLRRDGLATFARKGNLSLWSLTNAGRAAFIPGNLR